METTTVDTNCMTSVYYRPVIPKVLRVMQDFLYPAYLGFRVVNEERNG